MVHIGTYLQILRLTEDMLKTYGQYPDRNDKGYRMARMIYGAAFAALINEGMPYARREDVIVIETDGHVYGYQYTPEEGSTQKKAGYEAEAPAHSGLYEAQQQPDAALESQDVDLPEEMDEGDFDDGAAGEEYEDATDEKETKLSAEEKISYDNDSSEIEKEAEGEREEKEKEEEPPHPVAAEDKKEKGPAYGGEHKALQPQESVTEENGMQQQEEQDGDAASSVIRAEDYTMQKQVYELSGGNEKLQIGVLTMPLDITVQNPRILVGLMLGKDNIKVVASKKSRNKVTVNAEGYPVIIEGKMMDGVFRASGSLPRQYDNTDVKIRLLQERTYGKEGHAILENDEKTVRIHFLPIGFGNDPELGVGHFAYLLESTEGESCGSTVTTNGKIRFTDDGREWAVIGEWKENHTLGIYAEEV